MDQESALAEMRDFYRDRRVLVTGGLGFIASSLVDRLVRWGADVTVLDVAKQTDYSSECEYVQGDVREYDVIERATRDIENVFHFAAVLGVENVLERPREVLAVNLEGTLNALKAANVHDVGRFVFASSSEVYGEPRKLPLTEDEVPAPVSVYGVSKLAGETYCKAFSATSSLDVSIVRFFNVYGPDQGDGFVIPQFIGRVAEGEPPEIYGDGQQTRTFTYIDDAVVGALLAGFREGAAGQIINIGGEDTITIKELAELVVEVSDEDVSPVYRDYGDGVRSESREIFQRIPSIQKAGELLGYEPQTSIEKGVRLCYEAATGVTASGSRSAA